MAKGTRKDLKWFQKQKKKMHENYWKIDKLISENERIANKIYRKALGIDK